MSIGPGTAYTVRPCSVACCAVMSDPLRTGASTTINPWLHPATMRFRYGKVCLSAMRSTGYSLITAPFSAMRSANAAFSGGYNFPMPLPITAIVRPFAASAASCAAVSIPRARPLITV